MDWQLEQLDGEPDPLDRLLAEARWAEPAPEAIQRLRGQWRSLMVRRSRRRRRLFALAAAGSLLAAGLAFWQFISGTVRPGRENNITAPSSPQIAQPTTRKTEQLTSVPPLRRKSSRLDPLPGTAYEQAVAHGGSNSYELMLATAHRRAVRERRRQLAAAETADAVAEAKGPENSVSEPSIRDVAEATDSPTLGRLVREEQNPTARKELLSALLARDDRPSVNVFLAMVEDPRTSADSLACVAGAPNPPVQTLFQCLRSPRAARRIAAAMVLGRLDQAAVSRELIAMVSRGMYRQEAMIALLSSSETTARQFLANAERDPTLSATLWNAKRVFQTSLPWRS